MLCSLSAQAQFSTNEAKPVIIADNFQLTDNITAESTLKIVTQGKWKMNRNRWITGALVFTAGASKGFNETLQFHWKEFHRQFPNLSAQWFNPAISWKNKYKNGDPSAGPRFPMSDNVLVMVTDQYHLNNFINRVSWISAFVIKIGDSNKKPLKHYLLDLLYYSACYQAGFALTYYPFEKFKGD